MVSRSARVIPGYTLLIIAFLGACSSSTTTSTTTSRTTTVDSTPVDSTPVDSTPVDSTAVQSTSVQNASTSLPPRESSVPTSVRTIALGPLTYGQPTALGTGFFAGWANNETVMVASNTDDAQLGCEGFTEVVLEGVPVAGGARYRLTPSDPLRNGTVLSRGGRSVQIDACEGFITDIAQITRDDRGVISDAKSVEVNDTELGVLESAPQFTLSLDGNALLTTWAEEGSNTAARVDLGTGTVTQILKGIDGGRQIEDATNGRIALSDGTSVRIVGADGAIQQTYDAWFFDVSDDGTRIALIKDDQVWVTDVGAPVGAPATVIQAKGGSVALSPDNDTVAVFTLDYGDTEAPPVGWLTLVRGTETQTVFGPDYLLSVGWNSDGTALGFDTGKDEPKKVLAVSID
jgi:hypothetical protein